MFSMTGMSRAEASSLESSGAIFIGSCKRICHLPGLVVLTESGMMGHWYFVARLVGNGVSKVSLPNSSCLTPFFPAFWSQSIPRAPPFFRNLAASKRPLRRAKSLVPDFSRLL